jgi:histidinol-phosphate phosphatase family protein
MKAAPQPAIFVDRDGTLMEEVHYCKDPALICVFEGVSEGLRALRAAGFRTVLVTNQSGIGRGLIALHEYEQVHERLLELLGEECLDASYMCADAPGAPSARRKPEPGMLLEAARELNLDLARSWMVGDKDIDIRCGVNAGVPGILVRTGHGTVASGTDAVHIAPDFAAAARWIMERESASKPGSDDKALL